MSNVVQLPKRQPAQIPIVSYLTVDPALPLEEGCLMAYCFPNSQWIIVDQYWGRSGRASGGRFCRPGDPREQHWVGNHFSYSDDNVRNGNIVILGRIADDAGFNLGGVVFRRQA